MRRLAEGQGDIRCSFHRQQSRKSKVAPEGIGRVRNALLASRFSGSGEVGRGRRLWEEVGDSDLRVWRLIELMISDGWLDHHLPFLLPLQDSCSGVVEVYDHGCWGAAQEVSDFCYSTLPA
jgi:hypothetical protein